MFRRGVEVTSRINEVVEPPSDTHTQQSSLTGKHFAELDGLRAAAIWSVLAVHLFYGPETTAAARHFLPRSLDAVLAHGWLGVDLFFVLSGFLITRILLATKRLGRKQYFKRFYMRRALRILPICLTVIAILLIALHGQYTTYFTFAALMSANLVPAQVPVPDAGGPLWSLAVEEQFYLVWPWLVLWLDARRLMVVAAAIITAEIFIRMAFATDQSIDQTPFRVDGLAMGAFLAAWFSSWNGDRDRANSLAAALIGFALLVAIAGYPLGIRYGTFPNTTITQAVSFFGAMLVLVVAYRGHRILGFLRTPPLTLTALLSYAIYLVHRPVADGLIAVYGHSTWYEHLAPQTSLFVRVAAVIIISYALAVLSRHFIEEPCLRLGRKLS